MDINLDDLNSIYHLSCCYVCLLVLVSSGVFFSTVNDVSFLSPAVASNPPGVPAMASYFGHFGIPHPKEGRVVTTPTKPTEMPLKDIVVVMGIHLTPYRLLLLSDTSSINIMKK